MMSSGQASTHGCPQDRQVSGEMLPTSQGGAGPSRGTPIRPPIRPVRKARLERSTEPAIYSTAVLRTSASEFDWDT